MDDLEFMLDNLKGKIDSKDTMFANQFFANLRTPPKKPSHPLLAPILIEYKTRILKLIKNDAFNWNTEAAEKIKAFFSRFSDLEFPFIVEFANFDLFQAKFNPASIMRIVRANLPQYYDQQSLYDSTIRALSHLLQFFLNVHLMQTLAFKSAICSKSLHLYDPCFREKIREKNRADAEIAAKLFSSKFNLKQFVFLCLSRFFPNVSLRWLNEGMFAHTVTLKIIVLLFEYGLWKLDELDFLLDSLYQATETLFTLENDIQKDIAENPDSFSPALRNEWTRTASKCRKLVSVIYVHILVMHYDVDLMSSLPQFALSVGTFFKNEPLFQPANRVDPDQLYKTKLFKKKRFYTYMAYTLVTYLRRPFQFAGADKPIGSGGLEYFSDLLFSHVNQSQNSFYFNSLVSFQPNNLPYYHLSASNSLAKFPEAVAEKFGAALGKLRGNAVDFSEPKAAQEFTDEVKAIFKEIRKHFKSIGKDQVRRSSNQLACLLANLPQFILSLMTFFLHVNSEAVDPQPVVYLGIQVLLILANKNSQAANNLFSGRNLWHIEQLLARDVKNSVILIAKVFSQSSSFQIIENNELIFSLLIRVYSDVLETFLGEMNDWISIGATNFLTDNLASLIILNKLFKSLIKKPALSHFRFEAVLSKLFVAPCQMILTRLAEHSGLLKKLLSVSTAVVHHKLDDSLKLISNWDGATPSDKQIVIIEAISSVLSVFECSVSRVIIPAVFRPFFEFFSDEKTPLRQFFYLLEVDCGGRILGNVVRIFNHFMIFHQNMLFDATKVENAHVSKNAETYFAPQQLSAWLIDDLLALHAKVSTKMKTERTNREFSNFLLKSYLPLLFKYFSGVLYHLTFESLSELEDDSKSAFCELTATVLESFSLIANYFAASAPDRNQTPPDFLRLFRSIMDPSNSLFNFPLSHNEGLDSLRENLRSVLLEIAQSYSAAEKAVKYVSRYIKYDPENFNDQVNETITLRLEGHMNQSYGYASEEQLANPVVWLKNHSSIQEYEEVQSQANALAEKTFHVVKYFDFSVYSKAQFNVFGQKAESDYRNKNNGNLFSYLIGSNEAERQLHVASQMVLYFKERFKYIQDYYSKQPHINQIYRVLKLEDILKNNIECFVDYFIDRVDKMDEHFEDLQHSFVLSKSYKTLFLIMDSLIRSCKQYRRVFYDKISESGGQRKRVVYKIWRLHKALATFLIYKTFLDETWREFYAMFFIISNFIQNLCEDNFKCFKDWFFLTKTEGAQPVSLIEDYFLIIERAFSFNELEHSETPILAIVDKPELIFVYNRMMIGMTEFINGGQTLGQEVIYEKQIDNWAGVILRVVDDVDSPFYELKYAVVLYICATIEDGTDEAVNFLASNFSATNIFSLMTRLVHKLYIRQLLIKKARRKTRRRSEGKILNVVTKEDEDSHSDFSFETLIDFYKKYDATFADHIIINTVVSLYSFMRIMSNVVVRYNNFFKELNTIKEMVFSGNRKFLNETYDLENVTIWHFITSIIVQMEIRYVDQGSEDKTPRLMQHHFKKLPICFFLTQTVKLNFHSTANIDSTDLKHEEFFDRAKDHIIIMRDLRNIFIGSKFLSSTSTEDAFLLYMIALYSIGCVINLIFVIFYNKSKRIFQNLDPNVFDRSTYILAIVNASAALLFFVFWFLMKYPTERRINWEKFYATHSRSKKVSFLSKLRINIKDSMLMKTEPRNFAFHAVFSLLGLLFNPFFYTLLLLLIVDLSMIARSFVMSVIKNYDKLGATLLMIFVLVNFFSFLAADIFGDSFSDDARQQNICGTYFSCLINGFDLGIRLGGGISDKMHLIADPDNRDFAGRFLFDIFFFILINTILLGIFFGIIVDAFKEYRNELDKRSKDEQNVCFTCGLSRDVLQKAGIDFEMHIEYHDIWSYLFYLIYLKWKPVNSYDGIDNYIDKCLENNNRVTWMPIGTCLEFEQKQNEINKKSGDS